MTVAESPAYLRPAALPVESDNRAAAGQELAWMAIVALALRLLIILAAGRLYHVSLQSISNLGDGPSYQQVAKVIAGESVTLSSYDRRVFPGYPLLIALVHRCGVAWPIAALALSWTAASVAAPLAAMLCRDARVGWGMAVLTPHYVLYSSMAATESTFLALCVAGLLLACRPQITSLLIGGLVLGFAGVVRPVACFVVIGFLFCAYRTGRKQAAIIVSAASAAVVAVAAIMMHFATGSVLTNVRTYKNDKGAYNGELFTFPFKSLITTPHLYHVPILKVLYIWLYVLTTLLAVAILTRQWWAGMRDGRSVDLQTLLLPWLALNTLFILCVGSNWGFQAFHRFSAWALPPMLLAFAPILPRRTLSLAIVALGSAAIALYSIMRNM